MSDEEFAHYGVPGMKWGKRKARDSSSDTSSGWTDDQKQKLKAVGGVAAVAAVAVGGYYVAKALQGGGASPVSALKPSTVNAGKAAAEKVMASKPKLKMDKETSDFLADSARRMFEDQKSWSRYLGQNLESIQREDAAFMADFIKNWTPKAIGA